MKVTRRKDAPTFPAPSPSKKVTKIMIDPIMGSEHIAMGYTIYPVGEKGSPHVHTCEETILILKGKAKISCNEEAQTIEAGDVVYVSPGEAHTLENVGELELQFIWVYTPPGDERSIRERAKK